MTNAHHTLVIVVGHLATAELVSAEPCSQPDRL